MAPMGPFCKPRVFTRGYDFTGGVWNELPQSKPDGFASSLWEGASDAPASFLIAPDTLATRLTACALSVTFGDSSPKGRAKSTAESFLMMPDTLASDFKPWLPLRGKTSPAPGEDVTAGDKKGNLARERLRGRGKTLTALPERVKKVGQKRPQTFLAHK